MKNKNVRYLVIAGVIVSVIIIAFATVAILFFLPEIKYSSPTNQSSSDSSATKDINANLGGILELSGDTRLEIPPGALGDDATVTISEVSDLTLHEIGIDITPGIVREIEVDSSSIKQPVRITIYYGHLDQTDVFDQNAVFIARWDENDWIYLGGEVDQVNKTVSVEVDHLSIFGVFNFPSIDSLIASLKSLIPTCKFPIDFPEYTAFINELIQVNNLNLEIGQIKVIPAENIGTIRAVRNKIQVDLDYLKRMYSWLPENKTFLLYQPILAHELSHIVKSSDDLEILSVALEEAANNLTITDYMNIFGSHLSNLQFSIKDRDCRGAIININAIFPIVNTFLDESVFDNDYCFDRNQLEMKADIEGIQWASQVNGEGDATSIILAHYFQEMGGDSSCTHPSGLKRSENIRSAMRLGQVGGVYGRVSIAGVSEILPGNIYSDVLITTDGSRNEMTDDEGRFLVTGLSEGLHTLTFSKPGYETSLVDINVPNQDLVQAEITLNPQMVDENLKIVQIGVYDSTYLRYNPTQWEAFIELPAFPNNNAGEPIMSLRHKAIPGCILHDNLGRGAPFDWKREDTIIELDNLEYRMEKWIDTKTSKPVLIVYQHTPNDILARIELVIEANPKYCIQEAERVLALSSDILLSIDEFTKPTDTQFTKIIIYSPSGNYGKEISGSCWIWSIASPRIGSWRCISENSIYDPCFSLGGETNFVICGADIFNDSRGIKMNLTEPLPNVAPPETITSALAFELEDGTTCGFTSTGTLMVVEDNPITYFCSDGTVIVGYLQTGQVWTADKAWLSEDNSSILELERVNLSTVWR